jgi:hypothetical protein
VRDGVPDRLLILKLTVPVILFERYSWSHFRWVPCHHGMARPHVTDGGKSSGYGG